MEPIDVAVALREELRHEKPELEKWEDYYEGEQRLSYMHPELLKELEGRVRQVVVNWPRLVVDSLEERLDVEGFRLGDEVDSTLWGWWQANGLDVASQQAHIDALICGRSYAIVGTNEDDPTVPLITVESPEQVIARHDPRTRRVSAAIKTWCEDDDTDRMTLYLPDRTVHYFAEGSLWRQDGPEDVHNLGRVPVVPLINRGRTLETEGVSELVDIVPLSDAACKIATDMMVAADFHAIPRIVALGLTEDDFKDRDGRPVSKWEKIAGRIWATGSPPGEADIRQLAEADLRNFHETINSLARMASAMAGLPPHYFGWSDANPASADAIRSAETRLVKRAERRQRAFGESWEEVQRLGFLVTRGELPPNAARMETVWRDPSTPTIAQTADALGKLAAGLQIPPRALWPRVPNVTAEEVRRWESIADAERSASARAQAAAFGVTPDPNLHQPTPDMMNANLSAG